MLVTGRHVDGLHNIRHSALLLQQQRYLPTVGRGRIVQLEWVLLQLSIHAAQIAEVVGAHDRERHGRRRMVRATADAERPLPKRLSRQHIFWKSKKER